MNTAKPKTLPNRKKTQNPTKLTDSLTSRTNRALTVFAHLKSKYPNVSTFLNHDSPFQLLIAVILSAQCTDDRVNLVTPGLFNHCPTPQSLANADLNTVKSLIKSINFFNTKAQNIQKTAAIIHHDYHDQVPPILDKLIQLPGVGRKTANVVLGQAFDIPGITVDTHVKRVSTKLGFTSNTDPVKIEEDLMALWPKETWIDYSTLLILHGRHTCHARKPSCDTCEFNHDCPSAFK